MKLLAEDIEQKKVEKYYRQGGPDRIRIAALQTLLRDLGFATELKWNKFGADGDYGWSTATGVRAFGQQEDTAGDGKDLTITLAKRIATQLSRHYGNSWRTPSHAPTPAPGSLSITSLLGRKNRQFIEVSDGVRKKRFAKFRQGLFTSGDQKPAAYVASHEEQLRSLKISESEIKVMIAVAENEVNLDAINTWDNAFLSFDLFQWTAGQGNAKGELPALLARIKKNRDLFDGYCGQHGLDVTGITDGLVRGYFSFRGTTLKTAAEKAQLRQAPWAFYFWLAGQDPAIQALEIKHAIGRLDQFYSNERYKVDNRYLVSELVTSEYGVGLILDQHVNRPAHVRTSLARALRQTGLREPREWDSQDERTLINAYLKVREQTSMTHAGKRARVTNKYLKNGTISDRRGSFK